MKSKPICFVAMAFGKDDTNALYDKLILPILKENGITPIIINRRQSNQDLNIQIIEQLRRCDFSIVDLTYARPSVYYEAGFAERSVPVIYIVRSDHLSNNQPEHLRIHFDLQMKPLIIWDDIHDKKFSKKLESRLKATVLKEWLQKKKDAESQRSEIEEFGSLPQNKRLALLRRISLNRLKLLSYKKWEGPASHGNIAYRNKDINEGIVNGVFSTKVESKSFYYVSMYSYPSSTKNILQSLIMKLSPYMIARNIDKVMEKNVYSIICNHFVFSIRTVPYSRFEDVLSTYRHIPGSGIYESIEQYSLNRYGSESRSVPFYSSWHFLSGIKSKEHLEEMLIEHIDDYMVKQSS